MATQPSSFDNPWSQPDEEQLRAYRPQVPRLGRLLLAGDRYHDAGVWSVTLGGLTTLVCYALGVPAPWVAFLACYLLVPALFAAARTAEPSR